MRRALAFATLTIAAACGGQAVEQLTSGEQPNESPWDIACEAGLLDVTLHAPDAGEAADAIASDDSPTSACEPSASLAMPIDFLHGRNDVLPVWQGDSIASAQAQILPAAIGAPAFVNVSLSGKTMATMDEDFPDAERPAILASDASVKIASTNGGINDMRPGGGIAATPAATCAHLASWCAQVHDAGARALVFELSPVCNKILDPGAQQAYVDCEDALVDAGTCDYVIGRDMALVNVLPDGGYESAMLADCLHPTSEGAYRIASRYAHFLSDLADAGH